MAYGDAAAAVSPQRGAQQKQQPAPTTPTRLIPFLRNKGEQQQAQQAKGEGSGSGGSGGRGGFLKLTTLLKEKKQAKKGKKATAAASGGMVTPPPATPYYAGSGGGGSGVEPEEVKEGLHVAQEEDVTPLGSEGSGGSGGKRLRRQQWWRGLDWR